jgi:hypothetical protein
LEAINQLVICLLVAIKTAFQYEFVGYSLGILNRVYSKNVIET